MKNTIFNSLLFPNSKLLMGLTFAFTGMTAGSSLAQQANVNFQGTIGKTLAESKEYRAAPRHAKPGAPNVLWILLDDVGFGAASPFGGIINTPTFDSLSAAGLRYTNFHTTGVCSPTRAALLTGRNHHRVHMGLFPHEFLSAGFPGYDGVIPSDKGTVAEILRENGYSTYQLGKWHLTPDAELTELGPFDRWPSGKGFDHNFGFLGGAEDQYKPKLVEDNKIVQPNGKHLNELLIDKAIGYIQYQKKTAPDKPYFVYLAPGATHSPHQVQPEWISKYKGKFDEGWDVAREKIFANQQKLGLIPADAKLPARNERVKAWNTLSADEKKVFARFAEAYAGFLEQTDHEIGRLVAYLKESGQYNNTAIFVIIGDNGASKEGSFNGTLTSEFAPLKGDDKAQIDDLVKNLDKIGTADAYTNYPIGWAQTFNTPFRQWKADAESEGGTRNPLIVSWPSGITQKGGIRGQYAHLIDLLPTALELTGSSAPEKIRGIQQDSLQGSSLLYTFSDAKAATRHKVQYHYLFGAGSIYSNGWKAAFAYRPDFVDLYGTYPAPTVVENNAGKEKWALYNLNSDFNELKDLSQKQPEKLKELQALFDAEAKKNNAYPLINWSDVNLKFKDYFQKAAAKRKP